jgi:hypothetical protein
MPSITDFLKDELDKAVAARSGHQAKLDLLAIEQGNWALRFRRFARTGEQPFGGPHPDFGQMQATDFLIVLGMIDGARAVIKRRKETAGALQ